MQEEFKTGIEFNPNYDAGLMQTPKALILMAHVQEMYPRVYKKLSEESSVEAYVEPKVIKQLDLESDYRLEGYPLTGVAEIALRDVLILIKNDLASFEEKEVLSQFDLDLNPIIYTEFIKTK